jgi:hypothetical protein
MIYYLTASSEAHMKAVLVGLYEATTGQELPVDEKTGEKIVPQNDASVQSHILFSNWVIKPGETDPETMKPIKEPVLKPGSHCVLNVVVSDKNIMGEIGPQDTAMLEAAGIKIIREDDAKLDKTYLPKFQ